MDEDITQERIDWLIENGALNPAGIDENGVGLFVWNPERLQEVDPVLYEEVKADAVRETDEALKGLLEKGLVDVEFDDVENDFNIVFTEQGEKWAEANGIEII